MAKMKWLPLLSLILANFVELPSPVVVTSNGAVRGRISKNGRFYQYFSIPYGTVDESNRFQAPKPAPKWQGILDAIDENAKCPQIMIGSTIMGDENCLKLHIYTPAVRNPDKLLPVMVYLHGGCFFEGTGAPFLYGGDYFAEHGVVFVGINYRLNVEGFLCLGIKEAPGNAGLKDQVAALKWINQNIKAFGGDPGDVTLFGESAGSVSTSYLILSEAAKGLFHKAILQSGATLSPWALQHDPISTASALVKEFGYNTKDPYKIYSILSNKTATDIIAAIKYGEHQNYVSANMLFVPCVEKNLEGVEPIITEYPADIIQSGNYTKIPMIIGFNDREGLYFVSKDYGTRIKQFDVSNSLKSDLVFLNESDMEETVYSIKKYYFSKAKDDLVMDVVDLYSDLHFKYPIAMESQLYAQTTDQPIYYYLFKYSGLINMPKVISSFGLTRGASHADELFYMFKPHMFPLPHRFLEHKMIERMVTMWTNFAKFSNPTPKTSKLLPVRWKPSRASNPIALVIDAQLTTAPMWDEPSISLWNNTYTKYRRKNYVQIWYHDKQNIPVFNNTAGELFNFPFRSEQYDKCNFNLTFV